jgi:signal peptidase II
MENKKTTIFLIATSIIIFDQYTKWLVRQRIPLGKSIPIIDKFISLTHITNIGAAFGILSNGRFFFIFLSSISIIVIIVLVFKFSFNLALSVAFGFILGGISGNLIDRLTLGSVTDFIDIKFFSVFNLADSAITIGTIMILIYLLVIWKNSSK